MRHKKIFLICWGFLSNPLFAHCRTRSCGRQKANHPRKTKTLAQKTRLYQKINEIVHNFIIKLNALIIKTLPMIAILFLGLSIFLNTGCKKENHFPCDCTNNTVHVNSKLHHKWSFTSFENLSGKKDIPPSDLKEMHIEFNDSTLSVKGQNNTCGGSYEAYEKHCLNITNLSCTEVGGTKEQLEWESRYFTGLNQVECYEIENNKLKIYYYENGKQKIINFKK